LRNLAHEDLRQGSALDIPYADNSFDMVFSHGVLHHIPEIDRAQREIARVQCPGGELVLMVYAKWSSFCAVSVWLHSMRSTPIPAGYMASIS